MMQIPTYSQNPDDAPVARRSRPPARLKVKGRVRGLGDIKSVRQVVADQSAWANTLSRLHQLGTMVLSQSDLDHVYQEIDKAAIELTHADRSNIQLLDEETGTLRMVAQSQRTGQPFDPAGYAPKGWGVSTETIRQRRRVIVEDITHSPLYVGKPELPLLLASGVRATQATPLISSAGRLVGLLATQYNQPHHYSQRELQVLDLFARLVADTIERLRSESRLRQQYRQVAGINRIYQQITDQMTRERIAAITLETIGDLTGSDSGLVALMDESGQVDDIVVRQPSGDSSEICRVNASAGHWRQSCQAISPGLLDSIIAQGRPLIVNQTSGHPAFTGLPERHLPLRTFMGVPLVDYGRVIGIIAVANRADGYSQTDLATLQALGEAFVHLMRRWQAEYALQQSEARALQLVEELRKADRSKNEFLGILSHEIRNPLASITMSLSLLDRVQPTSPEAQKARSIIDRQTHQLAHLIDDLLDVTRIARNKVELKKMRINLSELLAQSAEDAQSQFLAKGVAFLTEIDPSPLMLEADPTRINQVVGNLLHNAAKFTIKGDEVRLTLKTGENMEDAIIEIADTGEGIAPDLLPNLFTPFTQADNTLDRVGGGLGLGLSIAKGLVSLHGGSIQVHSDGPGQGTRFTVRLPIAEGMAEDACQSKADEDGQCRPLRILVIEDSPDLAETFCSLLEILGHDVRTAHSGRTGLEKARSCNPDVILCDIGLPEMDGYEVARAVRAHPELSDVFMIAISGYAQSDDIERAMDAGFNRHLAKPVEMDKLRRILETEVVAV